MRCDYIGSSANPRLLILLTDESEESVKLVNYLIDSTIQINFDGEAPRNRCFISVIGYNHNVKELCSGWLRDLDANPLQINRLKRKVPDGTGKIVEVEVQQPVWIESTKTQNLTPSYTDAVLLSSELSQKWGKDFNLSPIVTDISEECYCDYAKEEIKQLKAISTRDGNVLFFGCYSRNEDAFDLFSKMPEEWEYVFKRSSLKEEDYSRGLFNRENIISIFDAMMEMGIVHKRAGFINNFE